MIPGQRWLRDALAMPPKKKIKRRPAQNRRNANCVDKIPEPSESSLEVAVAK
jgi:hypothetical protein